MSLRSLLLLATLPLIAWRADDSVTSHKGAVVNRDLLFREYALAVCVADGYESSEVKADASAVASGYLENGSFPLEAYNEARDLGRKFLKKDYPSIAHAKLTLMKCIDFSNGNDLAGLMRKYRKK